MYFILTHLWQLLLIFFIVTIVSSYIMLQQAKQFFYLRGNVVLHFSIFELEFPGNKDTIKNILHGIDTLAAKPGCEDCADRSTNSKRALKNNLLCDFIFMAGVYPFIAVLCIATACKMTHYGWYIFSGFAVLQLAAWLFDILENLYLLKKLKSPDALTALHSSYKNMVMAKWIFAVTGFVCSLFGLLYFWLRGTYGHTFQYVVLSIYFIFLLLLVIIIVRNFLKRKSNLPTSS